MSSSGAGPCLARGSAGKLLNHCPRSQHSGRRGRTSGLALAGGRRAAEAMDGLGAPSSASAAAARGLPLQDQLSRHAAAIKAIRAEMALLRAENEELKGRVSPAEALGIGQDGFELVVDEPGAAGEVES